MSGDNGLWTRTDSQLPPKGTLIDWISPSGIQDRGRFLGGIVWLPENSSMYVYYRPERWRLAMPEPDEAKP